MGKVGILHVTAPALWSCFRAEGHIGAKTQNYVESFHAQIAKVLGEKHVGVFRLLKGLQGEAAKQELEISRLKNGLGRKGTTNCYLDRNKRITAILNQRETYESLEEMLAHLSTCIGDESLPRHLDEDDDEA